eukprot:3823061-Prymnesium_polylepis.1
MCVYERTAWPCFGSSRSRLPPPARRKLEGPLRPWSRVIRSQIDDPWCSSEDRGQSAQCLRSGF